ncbi:MAG TPA: YbjQ family protein [Gemmataceae bacterium]|nr:YbjQ family protein [Gemmataceae bacterium]
MPRGIFVTTGNSVEGYEIVEYLGIVRGIVVRAQTITQGIRGAFSSIMGGNIRAFEEVCESARSQAYTRMVEHAQDEGADAVIAMRYDATEFAQGVTEVLAYGTAVKLKTGQH